MDKYIDQLIKEIEDKLEKLGANNATAWDVPNLKKEEQAENMEHVEEFLYGKEYELQDIIGLDRNSLPPPSKLTDTQISKLLLALNELLEFHHYQLAFPGELNDRIKYELLFEKLKEKQVKTNFGNIGIEFCSYMIEDCPIPGKCRACEDFKIDIDVDDLPDIEQDMLPDGVVTNKEATKEKRRKERTKKVKDTLENLEPDENNIPGIFNFCNRWCERCRFTNRCTTFQFEKELGFDNKETDMEDTLEDVGTIFATTLSMLKNKAMEFGIEIPDKVEETDHEINLGKNHPLAKQAMEYFKKVSSWLEKNEDYFSEIAANLYNYSQKNFKDLNDNLETIGWHMSMIPVKIVRALNPKDDFFDDDDDEFYNENRNATGKLVLECLDESIAAFQFFYPRFSKKQDEILDFLSTLEQIKSGINREIPEAKDFIRPGLDE